LRRGGTENLIEGRENVSGDWRILVAGFFFISFELL
jgi:hypothetical protein